MWSGVAGGTYNRAVGAHAAFFLFALVQVLKCPPAGSARTFYPMLDMPRVDSGTVFGVVALDFDRRACALFCLLSVCWVSLL